MRSPSLIVDFCVKFLPYDFELNDCAWPHRTAVLSARGKRIDIGFGFGMWALRNTMTEVYCLEAVTTKEIPTK